MLTSYANSRAALLGALHDLRHIHDSDAKHWERGLIQVRLARVRKEARP